MRLPKSKRYSLKSKSKSKHNVTFKISQKSPFTKNKKIKNRTQTPAKILKNTISTLSYILPNSQNSTPIIFGKIHRIGCPPCEALKEVWGDGVTKPNKNIINFGMLKQFKRIDIESNEIKNKLNKLNENIEDKTQHIVVESYPTIYKIVNKKVYFYNGDRSYDSLTQWLLNYSK